jgi:hypothetical protein
MKYTIQQMIKKAAKRARKSNDNTKSTKNLTIEFLKQHAVSKATIKRHRADSMANYNEDPFDQETVEILRSINFIKKKDYDKSH